MSQTDSTFLWTAIAIIVALTAMAAFRLISPTRYGQALAGGLGGLALARLALAGANVHG